MARILVLGAGFAGLWAAVGAARKLDEIGVRTGEVEILVVDRNTYHNIRVRNYEIDLGNVAIPLGEVLDPIGVSHLTAEVLTIDVAKQQVTVATRGRREVLAYDRLVLALGSELVRPDIPGLAANAFDVDTYSAAVRLNAHIAALSTSPISPGRSTVVVVGAGFTGIEVATEMPSKLGPGSPRRSQSGRGILNRGPRTPRNLRSARHPSHRDTIGNQSHGGRRYRYRACFR